MTPMYLGYSDDEPMPTEETKALLLLRRADIDFITTHRVTLRQYLEQGGQARFSEPLSQDLILEPYAHLKILHRLMQIHPKLLE